MARRVRQRFPVPYAEFGTSGGRAGPRFLQSKSTRLAAGAFGASSVTEPVNKKEEICVEGRCENPGAAGGRRVAVTALAHLLGGFGVRPQGGKGHGRVRSLMDRTRPWGGKRISLKG